MVHSLGTQHGHCPHVNMRMNIHLFIKTASPSSCLIHPIIVLNKATFYRYGFVLSIPHFSPVFVHAPHSFSVWAISACFLYKKDETNFRGGLL